MRQSGHVLNKTILNFNLIKKAHNKKNARNGYPVSFGSNNNGMVYGPSTIFLVTTFPKLMFVMVTMLVFAVIHTGWLQK